MRRIGAFTGAVLLLGAAALPAQAKPEKKAKEPAHLRYAHSYADAFAEAKDRNCVVFATFHEDT